MMDLTEGFDSPFTHVISTPILSRGARPQAHPAPEMRSTLSLPGRPRRIDRKQTDNEESKDALKQKDHIWLQFLAQWQNTRGPRGVRGPMLGVNQKI